MTDDLVKEIEEYVCRLYGGKTSNMNALRNGIFWKTCKNQKRIVDLFYLPPCQSSLKLLEEAAVLQKFGYNLNRKSWSMKVLIKNYSLEWVNEILPTDIDSSKEDGLECDEDDFD